MRTMRTLLTVAGMLALLGSACSADVETASEESPAAQQQQEQQSDEPRQEPDQESDQQEPDLQEPDQQEPDQQQDSQTADASDECFVGQFAVNSIESVETVDTPAGPASVAGDHGSLALQVTPGGEWTLSDDGSSPATFDIDGLSVQATMNGSASGVYASQGDRYGFEQRSATGTVRLESPVGDLEFDFADVGPTLAPSGVTSITCDAEQVTLVSESATLTLVPAGERG